VIRSIVHRRADADTVELPDEGRLASFQGASAWLNSDPLTPEGLLGRVVVVDFWTYTCVNWLRTLPYVRAWAEKYRDDGLTVIGVHTPEFGFEGNLRNVAERARALGVDYPIAVDTEYAVWSAFRHRRRPDGRSMRQLLCAGCATLARCGRPGRKLSERRCCARSTPGSKLEGPSSLRPT